MYFVDMFDFQKEITNNQHISTDRGQQTRENLNVLVVLADLYISV